MFTDVDHRSGTIIGAVVGFTRSMMEAIHNITLASLLETMIWAFVGATVGFFTTAMWKWIRKKISTSK